MLDIIRLSMNSRMTHGQHRCIKFLKLMSKFISNCFVLHREPTTVSVIFIVGFSNVSRMWKRPLNWSCVDCLSLCISFSWYYERREMCTICYITTSEPFITKIRAPWITDCLWKLSLFRILSIHSWITTPFWYMYGYSEMEIYIQLKWIDKTIHILYLINPGCIY